MTKAIFENYSQVGTATFRRRFGNWAGIALELAGLHYAPYVG